MRQKNMRFVKICIFMVIAALPSLANAAIYGDEAFVDGFVTDQRLVDSVDSFLETTNTTLALAVLNNTEDIAADAEFYYNLSKADITIVYDFGDNKIAIAKPREREVLSDQKINQLLDGRQSQKTFIVDAGDANLYLLNLVEDIKTELRSGEKIYGVCSIIKDGYCNESCYDDLDCDCGNGICEYHENYITCQKDCKKTSEYGCAILSDNYCDKNCPLTDIDCSFGSLSEKTFDIAKKKRTTAVVLQAVIGALLFMLVVILIYVLEKNKGFKKPQ